MRSLCRFNLVSRVCRLLSLTLLLCAACAARGPEADSLFLKAVEDGDMQRVNRILKSRPALVNLRDDSGATPLHHALEYRHPEVAKLLVARGADVTASDNRGNTPLHWAAERGYESVMSLLVEKGAVIHAENPSHVTPLNLAAGYGHLKSVEYLISKGASVNGPKDGTPPLHSAVLGKNPKVAEALCRAGANTSKRDRKGFSALDRATVEGCHDIGKVLVAWGANKTPFFLAATGEVNLLKSEVANNPAAMEAKTVWDMTLLHCAAKFGQVKAVKFLLASGARTDVRDNWQEIPLHSAVEGGNPDVVKCLLRRENVNACNWKKETPLYYAFRKRKLSIARLLVSAGADVNAQTSDGETALFLAVANKDLEGCRFLISRGANVNVKADVSLETPLHLAVDPLQDAICRALLKAGADLDAKNLNGRSPRRILEQSEPGAAILRDIAAKTKSGAAPR